MARAKRSGGSSSVPQQANTTSGYNTPRGELPSTGAYDCRKTGRGALPTESAPPDEHLDNRRPYGPPRHRAPEPRVEFRGSTLRSHPFASKRFHVLLNSLFKVLFNFPSRYLSAIGLVSVFSLRWSLPPTLGCIPKQPDSEDTSRVAARCRTGLTPTLGEASIKRTRAPGKQPSGCPKPHSSLALRARDSVMG